MAKPSSLLPPLLLLLRCFCSTHSILFIFQHGFQVWCYFFSFFLTCWIFLTGPPKLLILQPPPIFFLHASLPRISFFVIPFEMTQSSTAQSFLLTGSRSSMGQKLHLSTLQPFLSPFGAPQSQHSSDTSQCHSTSVRVIFIPRLPKQ